MGRITKRILLFMVGIIIISVIMLPMAFYTDIPTDVQFFIGIILGISIGKTCSVIAIKNDFH